VLTNTSIRLHSVSGLVLGLMLSCPPSEARVGSEEALICVAATGSFAELMDGKEFSTLHQVEEAGAQGARPLLSELDEVTSQGTPISELLRLALAFAGLVAVGAVARPRN
jgi:hypothetical protein